MYPHDRNIREVVKYITDLITENLNAYYVAKRFSYATAY